MRSKVFSRNGHGALIAATLAALIVLGGCSSSGNADQARVTRAHMKHGEYERAVESAQQALAEDPQDPDCIDLLSDAQTAAADHCFEQAKKLMAAHRPTEAKVELDRAVHYMPAHPGANNLQVEVDRAMLRTQQLTADARTAMGSERFEAALLAADQARAVDEANTDAVELSAQARSALVGHHLNAAQAALAAGDTATCLDHCSKAAIWDPQNALLLSLQSQAAAVADQAVAAAPTPAEPATTQPVEVVANAGAPPVSPPSPTTEPDASSRGTPALIAAEPAHGSVGPQPAGVTARREPPRSAFVNASRRRLTSASPETAARPTTQPGSAAIAADASSRSAGPSSQEEDALRRVPASGEEASAVMRTGAPAAVATRAADAGDSASSGTSTLRTTPGGNSRGKPLFTGTLSRENRRFKKSLIAMDGILVKLRYTDHDPADADLEIVAGKFKVKPDDLRARRTVKIRGASGRQYILTVVWVNADEETVCFGIDRVD